MDATKRCTCCGEEFTREEFLALPLSSSGVGERVDEWQRDAYRNCACGSTLVIVLEIYKACD